MFDHTFGICGLARLSPAHPASFVTLLQEGVGKVTLKELLEYSVKNPIPVKVLFSSVRFMYCIWAQS